MPTSHSDVLPLPAEGAPWVRLEGETPAEYELWRYYRELAPVYRGDHGISMVAACARFRHIPLESLQETARRCRWAERIGPWDDDRIAKDDARQLKAVARALRIRVGTAAAESAARLLESQEPADIKEAIALAELGDKFLGRATGEADLTVAARTEVDPAALHILNDAELREAADDPTRLPELLARARARG